MKVRITMKIRLVKFYNEHSYTHNYIYGFIMDGKVYMVKATSEILDFVTKLDKASRGAGYALRFKPDRKQKRFLLSHGAEVLCSAEFFKDLCEMSKYNKGEIFEMLVTQHYGQTWVKDNVPFTEDGDLTVDGIAYQIKFEKATFINEAQMFRMSAEA